jgi:hypothetical protein
VLYAVGDSDRTNLVPALGIARYAPNGTPGCVLVTGTPVCLGDGSGAACPCANPGDAGAGCANSSGPGGARLVAEGQANLADDTVTLRASGLPAAATHLFVPSDAAQNSALGTPFGDGLRCVGGSVVRLAIRTASGGTSSVGSAVPLDPSVSVAGSVLAPATRFAQVWYRDAQAFCTPSTFNLSNGVRLRYGP